MKSRCSTQLRSALLAGAAALFALGAAPSFAQSPDKPYYGYDENEIVVVPYGIQRERVRPRSGSVIPEEVLTLSRVVSTEGLDLRYDADVDALHDRIEYTAREVCHELDNATAGQSSTSDRECYRDALRSAELQVDAAVFRARTYASLK